MSVKKFKINRGDLENDTAVDFSLSKDNQPVDKTDAIEEEFVEEQTDDVVNPIIDYDKVRFFPYFEDESGNLNEIKVIDYDLYFLDGTSHTSNVTTYDQISFEQNDIKFRKNSFKRSFLRLEFYDSDNTMDQNLLTFSDLFCSLRAPSNDQDLSLDEISNNSPESISKIPVKFELTNPELTKDRIHEGFFVFWYKMNLPTDLYMSANFNNAKNGKSTDFMVESGSFAVDNFVNKLHTKFTLRKKNDFYYYILDRNYSPNVKISQLPSGNYKMTVELYEVNVQ